MNLEQLFETCSFGDFMEDTISTCKKRTLIKALPNVGQWLPLRAEGSCGGGCCSPSVSVLQEVWGIPLSIGRGFS